MLTTLILFGTFFILGLIIIGLAVLGDFVGDSLEGAANGIGHFMEGIFHFEYSGMSFHGFGTFFLGILLTLFGAVGVYLTEVYPNMSPYTMVPLSLLIASISASGMTYGLSLIFKESPKEITRMADYVGKKGVVTVSSKGVGDKGEVLFSERGTWTAIVMSDELLEVGDQVVVTEVVGNLLRVKH